MTPNFSITGADMWGIMAKPPRVYASQSEVSALIELLYDNAKIT